MIRALAFLLGVTALTTLIVRMDMNGVEAVFATLVFFGLCAWLAIIRPVDALFPRLRNHSRHYE